MVFVYFQKVQKKRHKCQGVSLVTFLFPEQNYLFEPGSLRFPRSSDYFLRLDLPRTKSLTNSRFPRLFCAQERLSNLLWICTLERASRAHSNPAPSSSSSSQLGTLP
ncbi:hypothetical protein HWI79_2459 [Cryptosporidium felis]|nr:hypothetical protein HWI79_2459 [Cryptosporidium felis]